MKRLIVSVLLTGSFFGEAYSQNNVGIGTATPNASALLHVNMETNVEKGLLVTGLQTGLVVFPSLGGGSRLMFYPGRSVFRAGSVAGTNWEESNVGENSAAFGYNTIAKGLVSTAFGSATSALGTISTAMGFATVASGNFSTATGNFTTASGHYSTAMGNYVSTTNFDGAFAIGDNSTTTVMQSFVANGFRSRFAGGYRLLTNSAANLGVVLVPDATSWGVASDVRLKENFLQINGEEILHKISAMPLTTWNYKAQLNKNERHYGPMAQDFYNAFGKDELGTIGCDTLINQQDFLGVNLIAIQALEKRTAILQKENEDLKARLEKLEKLVANKQ